eukprot:12937330-Prorocentrum_lima.AAC.1
MLSSANGLLDDVERSKGVFVPRIAELRVHPEVAILKFAIAVDRTPTMSVLESRLKAQTTPMPL